jgi:hypothetical protein
MRKALLHVIFTIGPKIAACFQNLAERVLAAPQGRQNGQIMLKWS